MLLGKQVSGGQSPPPINQLGSVSSWLVLIYGVETRRAQRRGWIL
jgi:hypothetical protein